MDAQKKTLAANERDPVVRAEWRIAIQQIDRRDLVFVDETSTTIAMTRRYARAPRGQRAHGSVPRNHGKATTLIGALSLEGLGAVMSLEGAVDREAFTVYVRELLCPSLRPGQVVVMDNLSAHKGEEIKALIEAAQCRQWFLPSYSPDFSPIEPCFSKVKEGLRAAEPRTQTALFDATGKVIDTVTSEDAGGWFTHCGYPPASPT